MIKKKIGKEHLQKLERLDNIHHELKNLNNNIDDLIEERKTQKTEFSFLLSLVGVGISVSSLLVRALSGNSQILLIGGGISLLLLIMVVSFMKRISSDRPIPKEVIIMLSVLFITSLYSIVLGLGII